MANQGQSPTGPPQGGPKHPDPAPNESGQVPKVPPSEPLPSSELPNVAHLAHWKWPASCTLDDRLWTIVGEAKKDAWKTYFNECYDRIRGSVAMDDDGWFSQFVPDRAHRKKIQDFLRKKKGKQIGLGRLVLSIDEKKLEGKKLKVIDVTNGVRAAFFAALGKKAGLTDEELTKTRAKLPDYVRIGEADEKHKKK